MSQEQNLKQMELDAIKDIKVNYKGREIPLGTIHTPSDDPQALSGLNSFYNIASVFSRASFVLLLKDVGFEIGKEAFNIFANKEFASDVGRNPFSQHISYGDNNCVIINDDDDDVRVTIGYDVLDTGIVQFTKGKDTFEIGLFDTLAEDENEMRGVVPIFINAFIYFIRKKIAHAFDEFIADVGQHTTRETAYSLESFFKPRNFFEYISLRSLEAGKEDYLKLYRIWCKSEDKTLLSNGLANRIGIVKEDVNVNVNEIVTTDDEGNIKEFYLRLHAIHFQPDNGLRTIEFYVDLLK